MSDLYTLLQETFPQLAFKKDHLLAPYTTVKIGGPAEVFFEAKNQDNLIAVLSFARKNDIRTTVFGWGANTLISDAGIKGLVIRNAAGEIQVYEDTIEHIPVQETGPEPRFDEDSSTGDLKYSFKDLDYDESSQERVQVEIGAGVALNRAIVLLLNKGITGLQWYARIPSTIGGAIYNNIHGGTHFIGEVVTKVKVMDEQGEIKELSKDVLDFDYDSSRFHNTNEFILSVTFTLYKGDVQKAKYVYTEWNKRKSIQPSNSLGCTFQNISNKDKEALGYPTTSVGYIVEHVLKMKGYSVGDAHVSEYHCAFIENKGKATSKQYLQVIKDIIYQAKIQTGLIIKPEIFFLGFEKSELEGIVS